MLDQALLLDLGRRYCEPHRHYHTLEHIAYMLVQGRDLQLTDDQILAIWFHDAIYDVRSTTNEADSADLAVEMLSERGHDKDSIEAVRQMVLDSEKHVPTIPESAIVVDLDLCSLAAPVDIYDRNGLKLRKEYSFVGDDEYESNLRNFLRGFLARERIFYTPWGESLEELARANLQRSLNELGVA